MYKIYNNTNNHHISVVMSKNTKNTSLCNTNLCFLCNPFIFTYTNAYKTNMSECILWCVHIAQSQNTNI